MIGYSLILPMLGHQERAGDHDDEHLLVLYLRLRGRKCATLASEFHTHHTSVRRAGIFRIESIQASLE